MTVLVWSLIANLNHCYSFLTFRNGDEATVATTMYMSLLGIATSTQNEPSTFLLADLIEANSENQPLVNRGPDIHTTQPSPPLQDAAGHIQAFPGYEVEPS